MIRKLLCQVALLVLLSALQSVRCVPFDCLPFKSVLHTEQGKINSEVFPDVCNRYFVFTVKGFVDSERSTIRGRMQNIVRLFIGLPGKMKCRVSSKLLGCTIKSVLHNKYSSIHLSSTFSNVTEFSPKLNLLDYIFLPT